MKNSISLFFKRNCSLVAAFTVSLTVATSIMTLVITDAPWTSTVFTGTGSVRQRTRERKANAHKRTRKQILLQTEPRRSARFLRSDDGAKTTTSQNTGKDTVNAIVREKAGCGDKLVIDDEECDDGNTSNGDGCSSGCDIESGYHCGTTQPSICVSECGDGAISSDEECDDFGRNDGDGCNAYCNEEPGWSCTAAPSVCTHD